MNVLTIETERKARDILSTPRALLLKAADDAKSSQQESEDPQHEGWIPQRVDFTELTSYLDPFHNRAINIKAMTTVGMGLEGADIAKLPGNPFESCLDVWHEVAQDVDGCGNGYIEVVRNRGGAIAAQYWIPADMVEMHKSRVLYRQVNPDTEATTYFRLFGAEDPGDSVYNDTKRPWEELHELIHIRLPHRWSTFYGGPDWLGALRSLLLADAARSYNQDFFANDCIPDTIIYMAGKELSGKEDLTEEEIEAKKLSEEEQAQEYFHQNHGVKGKKRRALLITGAKAEGKLQIEQLNKAPKDADFIKLLDKCRDEIISAHGVPPRLLGVVVSGQLGGGSEMVGQLEAFKSLLVRPRQEIWESVLNRTIGPELGVKIKFVEPSFDGWTAPQEVKQKPESVDEALGRLEKALEVEREV